MEVHQIKQILRNRTLCCFLALLGLIAVAPQASAQKNLAQGKQTVQSCTYGVGASSRAVDGNTDGEWTRNSVSHTCKIKPGDVNWFMVDLGGKTEIQRIELWNRTGDSAKRLENYVIFVSERSIYEPDVPAGTTAGLRNALLKLNRDTRGAGLKRYNASEGQRITFTPTNANNIYVRRIQGNGSEWTGRYVTIGVLDNQYDNDYLQLAEIKVFGEKTADYTDVQVHGENVQFVKFNAGSISGRFIQTGGGVWQEQYYGRPALTSTLKETQRDEWSVYLQNQQNGYSVQIDLHKKRAYSTPPNGQKQEGHRLFSAQKLDSNGYNLTEFTYIDFRSQFKPKGANHFKKIGAITWRQIDYLGQEHTFKETGRDDSNVYLRDASRNKNIVVDTFSRKVLNLGPDWFEITEMNSIPTSAVLESEVLDYLRISEGSLKKMVDWMVDQANRAEQPVCWKDTYSSGGPGASCQAGYTNTGLLCSQQCSGVIPHSTDCGAGCAKSSGVCAGDILNQSLASADVLANIAGAVLTGGSYNAAKTAAKAAVKGGSKAAAKAAFKKAIRIGQRQIADELKDNFGAKLATFARQRSRKAANDLVRSYSQDMVERTGEWLAKEISERAAGRIMAAEVANDPDLRELAELFDPTGIAAVVNAFDKNSCRPAPLPR